MFDSLPSVLDGPVSGSFLVASPLLPDPNFMHSVVLLCRHGEEGSYGLVMNRPGPQTLADLTQCDPTMDLPLLIGREDTIWLGGPVGRNKIQVVHRLGDGIPDSTHVAGDVFVDGHPTALHERLLALPTPAKGDLSTPIRFVAGYAGWGEGQLDLEFQTGSWIACPASSDFIFDAQPDTVWRRLLRSFGEPFATLATLPPDPTWN